MKTKRDKTISTLIVFALTITAMAFIWLYFTEKQKNAPIIVQPRSQET